MHIDVQTVLYTLYQITTDIDSSMCSGVAEHNKPGYVCATCHMDFSNSGQLSAHRQGTSGSGGTKHPWVPHGNPKTNQFCFIAQSPYIVNAAFCLSTPPSEVNLPLTTSITKLKQRPVYDAIIVALMRQDPSSVIAQYFTSQNRETKNEMDPKSRFNPLRCIKLLNDITEQNGAFYMRLKFHIFNANVAKKVKESLRGFACVLDADIMGASALLSCPGEITLQEPKHPKGHVWVCL